MSDVDALVREHLLLARRMAGAWTVRTPPWETFDQIHGAALYGLWDAARRYDPARGRFDWFAAKVIGNAIRTHLKREGHRGTIPLDSLRAVPAEQPDPSDRVIAEQQRADLLAQVASLPAPMFDAVMGRHFRGETAVQIAARLGVHPATVRHLLRRAYALLRLTVEAAA